MFVIVLMPFATLMDIPSHAAIVSPPVPKPLIANCDPASDAVALEPNASSWVVPVAYNVPGHEAHALAQSWRTRDYCKQLKALSHIDKGLSLT